MNAILKRIITIRKVKPATVLMMCAAELCIPTIADSGQLSSEQIIAQIVEPVGNAPAAPTSLTQVYEDTSHNESVAPNTLPAFVGPIDLTPGFTIKDIDLQSLSALRTTNLNINFKGLSFRLATASLWSGNGSPLFTSHLADDDHTPASAKKFSGTQLSLTNVGASYGLGTGWLPERIDVNAYFVRFNSIAYSSVLSDSDILRPAFIGAGGHIKMGSDQLSAEVGTAWNAYSSLSFTDVAANYAGHISTPMNGTPAKIALRVESIQDSIGERKEIVTAGLGQPLNLSVGHLNIDLGTKFVSQSGASYEELNGGIQASRENIELELDGWQRSNGQRGVSLRIATPF